jgi:hypothetical protein
MIGIKEAIAKAKEFAAQILDVSSDEMLLEEIRSSDQYWDITLSFNSRLGKKPSNEFTAAMEAMRTAQTLLSPKTPFDLNRELKTFRVTKLTGNVEEMFIVQPV